MTIVQIEDCAVHLQNPTDSSSPPKTFTYDSSYDSNAPTEAIYNDICYSLVENVLEGYNGTIFAYGQTGCGKSHTMQGPEIAIDSKDKRILEQRGLISRSFDHIFEAISVSTGVQYLALVSYLEIYNENIRDLLNPTESSSNLALKEQPGEGVCVQNLSTHTVHNAVDCERLLAIGTKNRIVGATLMNATSSRSHSIFTISLEQITTNDDDKQIGDAVSIKKGKLNLVDLAGSERQNKTGATGDRLKEATKINLSLSALGNVISALVDGKTKHVPYRDSKLTRLLQDSLGGNTKTLMIACISPAAYNYDESLSTLRYASRAKNIHNKPKINEDPKDAILREYQEEILKLKQLLNGGNNVNEGNVSGEWLNEEKLKLKTMYEAETERLKREHEMQKKEKEDLVRDMEQLKLHYESQLTSLSEKIVEPNNNSEQFNNRNVVVPPHGYDKDAINIKGDLIGGERANDVQLKEKHKRKKQAAESRMSALANVLNRIEQSQDRDILQGHYISIQQELQVKTDALKSQRQKVRALEREVSDLQSEFQLDRADYLETIRRLDKNLKFYQQLIEKALPLLRRDGRFWDVDAIKADAVWNDDLQKWKLPENSMIKLKLPPAVDPKQQNGREKSSSLTAPGRLERSSNQSSKHSSHTNLSSTTDGMNEECDSEADLLIKMSGKRSRSFKCAVHHRDREVCSENDFHIFLEPSPLFKRMVHVIAMEVLPEERDRKFYADNYSCCPPPLFVIFVTLVELSFFTYHILTSGHAADPAGPVPIDSIFIYRPDKRQEVWRFLFYMVLHAGWFHLGFNLVVQLLVGLPLEMVHGSARIACVYLAGVLAGSLGTSVFDPEVYLVGASGGVYALLAAHLANVMLNYNNMQYGIIRLAAIFIFASCDVGFAIYSRYAVESTAAPSVSYVAHLTGALAGLTIGLLVLKNFEQKLHEQLLWWIALGVYAACTIFAVVYNLLNTVTAQRLIESEEVIKEHLFHDLGI